MGVEKNKAAGGHGKFRGFLGTGNVEEVQQVSSALDTLESSSIAKNYRLLIKELRAPTIAKTNNGR